MRSMGARVVGRCAVGAMADSVIERDIRAALQRFSGNPSLRATNGEVGALGSAVLDLAKEVSQLRIELNELKSGASGAS